LDILEPREEKNTLDVEVMRGIAGVAGTIFIYIAKEVRKSLDKRDAEKQRQERSERAHSEWSEIKERLEEFDGVIYIPDDHTLPPEVVKLIEERNMWKLTAEHYAKIINKLNGLDEDHGNIRSLINAMDTSEQLKLELNEQDEEDEFDEDRIT